MSAPQKSRETPSEARARLRRAARLAAVQALYQMEIGGRGASTVIREFRDHRFGAAGEGEEFVEADEDFFDSLVSGVVERQAVVDPAIDGLLADGWRMERLDATVRAILRVAGYELFQRKDVPARVVIDEYVDVANAFFEGSEPKFVNAALDRCARQARPDEF
ncbi:MAG: transcription antitermination factor NusB [Oceanicaulis sp.]|uniref:Transcription antitermination protein NusB n=1 Tax=Maricaulis virginensis TaxID=144022 RepID=A0A9W6IMD7_9PROT|nr:transcription antitermination factor NusB [Maricaulis virginensis]MAC39682.1 transcription antitermination factor NusB [Oceanicaulis sp.]MAZ91219.1 transcription antitermination factor NusB [Maricaulis sp.]MBI74285.1 transcription antitermination factor NusB [Oceanicaulis sp.]GLK52174.1 N utilization substance protein B [Maricaulis virginensis]|tara:strand:+ start:70 stop:558 length:489 start_codon:yes stop_codon:yes gene_type:complete